MKKYRQHRLEKGLCTECGKHPHKNNEQKCDECSEKNKNKSKKSNTTLIKYRRENGLCIECGKNPTTPGIVSCEKCRKRKCDYSRKKRTIALSNGMCTVIGCSNPLLTKIYCKSCHEKIKEQQSQRYKHLLSTGICIVCGKEPATPCGRCKECQLKYLAGFYLNDRSQWQALNELFLKQHGRCAYTGIPIAIGSTASIDHILAKSKGGQNIISNYQWTHCWINIAKKATIHDEFIIKLKEFIEQLKNITSMPCEFAEQSNLQL